MPTSATIEILRENIQIFKDEGRKIYLSSSFQTQSVPLLHILSVTFPEIPVLFIDTGFLFAETYEFKNQLERDLGLNVITVRSRRDYAQQRTESGLFLYSESVDHCCQVNKVEPVADLMNEGDVWISGVRRDQTAHRAQMQTIEFDARGVIRLHPMLNWTGKDIYAYIREHNLPKHPLEEAGYVSIGCVPCTHKWSEGSTRGGRWLGRQKTECGLHVK